MPRTPSPRPRRTEPADKTLQPVRERTVSADQCVVRGCYDQADVLDLCAAHWASRRGDSRILSEKVGARDA